LAAVSSAYDARFERYGRPRDLDRAIETGEKATAAASADDPNLAAIMSNLCGSYRSRFQLSADIDDLDRSIRFGEQAVAATPGDHPSRSLRLNNLSAAYGERFEHGDRPTDVDRAIELGTEAVACGAGQLVEMIAASNLASSLRGRYAWRGASEDLDRAVQAAERAVAATPMGHLKRGLHLMSLALVYQVRFQRSGSAHDLEKAIRTAEQAIAETPHDDPGRARPLSYLSFAYARRFRSTGNRHDLDRAIEAGAQAVTTTAPGHPELPSRQNNLSLSYLERFGLTGVEEDLDRATTLAECALAALPAHHPDVAGGLFALGKIYHAGVLANRRVGADTLSALVRQATRTASSAPEIRVLSCLSIGWLAHTLGEHEAAVELLDTAVSLLPTVAPRALDWADREHRLGGHLGLVGEAVAAHCAYDDPIGAVQIAELGRGLLLHAQLESRTDLADLEHRHPTLARRFTEIRDELHESSAPDRHERWAEYDTLLTDIRRRPGFDRFLMPPRPSETRRMAEHGPVLLVNAGSTRGDAVIIAADTDPVLVPLPHLTLADVNSYAAVLRDDAGVWTGSLRRRRVLPELLGWLWDTVVGPTLDALPAPRTTKGDLPRVWWMPIGLVGLLPLHAAGRPRRPGALDRVISSYTSTLRTLAHGRARPATTRRRQLSVGVRTATGLPALHETVKEADIPHAQHPDARLLTDQQATVNEVLAALGETTWAHFACHASTDVSAPSRSGLMLHDGHLTVRAISRHRLDAAELAYLSACSTAHRGWQHAEECLHLASAFQLAGFRHVIASLWPLADDIAAEATREFYRHLPASAAADQAPLAIHRVTLKLRSDYPDRPDLWASLIHSGP
jgi:tetratricopeptide (TPR) repeat protein